MEARLKANELGNKFYRGDIFTHGKEQHLIELEFARHNALIAVDELIQDHSQDQTDIKFYYWKEVRQEIELL